MDKLPSKLPPVQPTQKPTETVSTRYDPPQSGNPNVSYDDAMETVTVLINGVKKIVKKDEKKKE